MHQGWIIAYITFIIIVAHGYAENLYVTVVPTRLGYSEKQNVEVILNYKNAGPDTVSIYDWYLPKDELMDQLFEITRDGQSVEYVGPLVKRQAPTAKNMISVQSGKNVSTRVLLSSVYNMTETGSYVVQFKVYAGPTLFKSSRKQGIDNTSSNATDETILQSNAAALFVVGRRNALIEKSVQVNAQVKAATYTYNGCNSIHKTQIGSAIKSATSYSSSTLQYLSTLNSAGTARYTTWFGTYSVNNKNTLKSHFTSINSVFNTQSMKFDCTCNQANIYAYVYPNQPYVIYLCPVFWKSSVRGTDSMGGTLIHETSHFSNVADTDDYAYGQSSCKSLARSSPTKALGNADSHQYFAENNPALK